MSQPDLIVDYYRRDLDDAEEAQLAALLQASPAEAERFAALAADDYRAFGLPDPDAARWRGAWKLAALLLALGAGGAALWLARPARQAALAVADDGGSFEVQAARPQAPQRRPAAEPAETAKIWVSAQTPQGPFDVRVSGAEAEALGVFDAQGRKVGELVDLGDQRFRWSGRDRRDGLAAPGAYQFRLRAGDQVLKQWVEIEVR